MPPIKGRMMARMGGNGSLKDMKSIIKRSPFKKRNKTFPVKSEPLPTNIIEDEKLMKLRMPNDIVRILPSVKKYKGGKDFVDLTENGSNSGESSRSDLITDEDLLSCTGDSKAVLGLKRGRGSQNKFVMKLLAEEKFSSMIWDVKVSPTGDQIYVSCCQGVFICDLQVDKKSKLDKIILPGGMAFLPDGQFVVLCRNSDTVNFFSKDSIFIKCFAAGFSPMDVIVQGKDTLIISDPGEKSLHIFDTKGTKLYTVPSSGKCYNLEWPLYLSAVDEQSFVVCDCHTQKVLKFKNNGKFVSCFKLNTLGNNSVLRPHGICLFKGDLFVIDTSMDSIEAFTKDDNFIQTVIPREDGLALKPKCVDVSSLSGVFVVGGRSGIVRVYEFLDTEYYDQDKGETMEFKIKKEITKVKVEIECEEDGDSSQVRSPQNMAEEGQEESSDEVILLD